jgi:hypothetical protein
MPHGLGNRFLQISEVGGKPTAGVHDVMVEHDDWCGVFHGRGCDCVPNVSITNDDTVVIVDEHGDAKKVSRS